MQKAKREQSVRLRTWRYRRRAGFRAHSLPGKCERTGIDPNLLRITASTRGFYAAGKLRLAIERGKRFATNLDQPIQLLRLPLLHTELRSRADRALDQCKKHAAEQCENQHPENDLD